MLGNFRDTLRLDLLILENLLRVLDPHVCEIVWNLLLDSLWYLGRFLWDDSVGIVRGTCIAICGSLNLRLIAIGCLVSSLLTLWYSYIRLSELLVVLDDGVKLAIRK